MWREEEETLEMDFGVFDRESRLVFWAISAMRRHHSVCASHDPATLEGMPKTLECSSLAAT